MILICQLLYKLFWSLNYVNPYIMINKSIFLICLFPFFFLEWSFFFVLRVICFLSYLRSGLRPSKKRVRCNIAQMESHRTSFCKCAHGDHHWPVTTYAWDWPQKAQIDRSLPYMHWQHSRTSKACFLLNAFLIIKEALSFPSFMYLVQLAH